MNITDMGGIVAGVYRHPITSKAKWQEVFDVIRQMIEEIQDKDLMLTGMIVI